MNFLGMISEEGSEVATAVSEAGQKIMEIVGDMTSVVNSVEWQGQDYEAYRDDWGTFTGGPLADLVNGLQEKGKALEEHAQEQVDGSTKG